MIESGGVVKPSAGRPATALVIAGVQMSPASPDPVPFRDQPPGSLRPIRWFGFPAQYAWNRGALSTATIAMPATFGVYPANHTAARPSMVPVLPAWGRLPGSRVHAERGGYRDG